MCNNPNEAETIKIINIRKHTKWCQLFTYSPKLETVFHCMKEGFSGAAFVGK